MAEEWASAPWDEHAFTALFKGLYEGLCDAELTARLGRSLSSLSSVSSKLLVAVSTLDPNASIPGTGLDGLRALVFSESEQDWIPLAREEHRNTGRMFWGVSEDKELARAWESQTETISGVAARLGTGDGDRCVLDLLRTRRTRQPPRIQPGWTTEPDAPPGMPNVA